MNYNRKPCQNSGYLLWQISNIWQKRINDILSEHDITHVQYLLLATILWMEEEEMPINQINLARNAKSHKMMTSKVVRSLEKNGYVVRQDDPSDTRSKVISLTVAGRNKYYEVQKIFEREDKKFFSNVERNRFSMNSLFTDMLMANKVKIA